jgi:hypothetical protein
VDTKHGTHRAYQGGCRCDECKAFRAEYYKQQRSTPEYRAQHNEYQKKYHAERWARDPEYREWYRTKARKSGTRRRSDPVAWGRIKENSIRACRKRRDMIQQIKLERGCADCGYRGHPEALEFDHVESGKAFAISRIKTHSLEAIMAEIDKCEVVCANCHRIRTYNRRREAA